MSSPSAHRLASIKMFHPSLQSVELRQASPGRVIDRYTIVPLVVCIYVSIVSPFISFVSVRSLTLQGMMEAQAQWDSRIVWPMAAASSIGLAALYRSRGGRLTL